ncbi:MAG: hypothetical protein DSM106950_26270 [Stigonema ocellatum SAG 48.90 = DSM 106950]|nr:hypothetical protein [Stigonema ocellatum SAG 48.90 = DSM 106950]
MAIPLAVLGDKQISIKFQEEPFFSGRLRDIATPYVVFATALSLGAGISAAAVYGWRNSSRKGAEFEQQLSVLEEHMQEKDQLLKELKLSESRLQVSGLNNFLDDEVPFEQGVNTKILPINVSQPVVAQTPVQVHQLRVHPANHNLAKKNTNETVTAVAAASSFASAQTFLGYKKVTAVVGEGNKTVITPSEFEELQKQLREMMLQMQTMHNNLQLIPQTRHAQVNVPDKFRIYYDSPNTDGE